MTRRILIFLIFAAGSFAQTPKPLTLTDVLAWKHIQEPIASNDGKWFAYKLSPNDGDSTVVLKSVGDGKEQRFAIGEIPRVDLDPGAPPPPPVHDLTFSEDGKWLAFNIYPTVTEARALKKAHKPLQKKVALIELATLKKTEFEGIKKFDFSGERSTALALHRYPPTPAGTASAGAAPATPPAEDAKAPEKPSGSDLIVVTLATSEELNLGNVSEFAFNKPGTQLAWIVDAQDQMGNGISVLDLATGKVTTLDSAKATYKGLSWTEKGDALATVRGIEDKAWEDKLYSIVAFRSFTAGGAPTGFVFDPSKIATFPKDMTVSPERAPAWLADLSEVTFGIHEIKPKAPTPDKNAEDKPDMVIWHYKDPRLVSMQVVQQNADKNFSFACAWNPATGSFVRLADPALKQVRVTPDSKFGIGTDVREYELMGNLDGRRYSDIYSVDLQTGERKLAVKKVRWEFGASPDATHELYYDDGNFFTWDFTASEAHNLTKGLPVSFIDSEDDHNVVKPPTRTFGWSKDSAYVLISDNWDIWKVPANGGAAVNLTNGRKDKIRYNLIYRLDPDEKGYDLSKPLYIRSYGEWTKKGGLAVLDPGATSIRVLHYDDAAYTNLIKAKNASVYFYTRETNQEFPDFYSADASLNGTKITDANPQQKDFAWTKGAKLIEYTGARGDKMQGDLYLPANYEPGKKYPTVLYLYEKLTQATNAYPQPGFNGFSISFYTSNGYAVIEPDIEYKINDPGISSTACVLAALKSAVATGVVDPARVGMQGHSWGGYQTAFAVTQTNAFKAAIAGAPLTDMVSMYSSIYWNTGSTNQPIFESSQGRFTGGYWDENSEAYIRNSPVYHAQNVQTPLVILSNDKDGAVDHTQAIEYFNTLRRLQKPVIMLEYKGENHGLRKPENMKDYTARMKEFFDFYLMDKPEPRWMKDGVPLLEVKDELDERAKSLIAPERPAAPATSGSNQ
ncbi:MAG: prolyl oligopeptidase family serine peptidase [Terracidiphilus sp.]|jgi:dipeptidyl aminopeptidase/acylaminoacyl peptidase